MENLFQIVYEDDEFLVINKPAGLVCHPTKSGVYSSLVSRVRLYLGEESRPQLINRLDRETSGITLIAKTADVARNIRRLWENRQVTKDYLAIVHGKVTPDHNVITASLGKDEQSPVAIKDCVRPDGAAAETEYWVQRSFHRSADSTWTGDSAKPGFSVLRVVPRTGRKHQIRIHLAYVGHPVVGDKLYGGDENLYLAFVEGRLTPAQWTRLLLPNHALHAAALCFQWKGEERRFQAEPESWFKAFCSWEELPA